MEIVTASALMDRAIERPRDIVNDGVLGYNAFTLVSGQPGVGKSLLVMQLASCIARGVPWLGFDIPMPQRVLLLQKEMDEADLKARLCAQNADHPPMNFLITPNAWDVRLDPSGARTVIDEAVLRWKPKVLILDPLAEFGLTDENDASTIQRILLGPISRWKAGGTSVIIVHHHAKGGGEHPHQGIAKVRGSSALTGACDTNLQLSVDNHDRGWVSLEFAKLRRYAPRKKIPLILDPETASFYLRSSAVTILAEIEAQGGDMTVSDITDWAVMTLRMGKSTAYKTVTRLVEDKKLEQYQTAVPAGGLGGRLPGRVRIRKPENSGKNSEIATTTLS